MSARLHSELDMKAFCKGLITTGLLVLIGLFCLRWYLRAPPGPTEKNFHRLRVSMSRGDVYAVLGKPIAEHEVPGGLVARWDSGECWTHIWFVMRDDRMYVTKGTFNTMGRVLVLKEAITIDSVRDWLPMSRR